MTCIGLAALVAAASAYASVDLRTAVIADDRAQVDGDGVTLRRLLAGDYVLVDSAGVVQSKTDLIAGSTAPGVKLELFRVVQPVERVWNDGAVVGGVVRLTDRDHGVAKTACLSFADMWSHRRGAWQVAYTQVARAAAAECA